MKKVMQHLMQNFVEQVISYANVCKFGGGGGGQGETVLLSQPLRTDLFHESCFFKEAIRIIRDYGLPLQGMT